MGNKDSLERSLLDHSEVFADVLNVLLFGGEQVINAGDLFDKSPRMTYRNSGKIYGLERDVVKSSRKDRVEYCLFGIENQSSDHPYMPMRVIGYDGADYRFQIKLYEDMYRKYLEEKKRYDEGCTDGSVYAADSETPVFVPPGVHPVITVVLHYGLSRWKAPKTLCECFDVPPELRRYVKDYPMNLFEIAFLDDEVIGKFRSDFQFVASLVKQTRLRKEGRISKITIPSEHLLHVEDTYELLYALSQDKGYLEILSKIKKGEAGNMFSIFEDYKEQCMAIGEERGIKLGEERGIKLGESRGIKTGEEQGQRKLQKLLNYLSTSGEQEKMNEAFSASPERLREMYRQYGID